MKQGLECMWSEKLSKLDRWKEAKAYMRMCIIILTLGDRTDSAKDSWEVHRMSPELSAWRQCNYPPSTRAAPRGVGATSLLGSWVSRCAWCGDCCSVTQSCLTLCDPMDCSTPGFPVLHHLLELAQMEIVCSIESMMPFSNLILCLSLLLLPLVFPSIRIFSNESVLCIRWPKYWSFSFSISPSNEYLELISFRIDWLDLLAVQGTLKSLLQHHSLKASIHWYSAFFMVQLSHPYKTIGKTIVLTRQTFVSKVMSLLFNTLSLSLLFFQGASVF